MRIMLAFVIALTVGVGTATALWAQLPLLEIDCRSNKGDARLFHFRGDFRRGTFEWHWPPGDEPVIYGHCVFQW